MPEPKYRINVMGPPTEGEERARTGRWCDEQLESGTYVRGTYDVVYHRQPKQMGADWICLLCGEIVGGGEA